MPPFRADRLASLYFFHPLQRLRPRQTRIPILMYHSISNSVDSNRHPYYRTTTTPAMFAQQMQFLHENGYQTIGVTEASKLMQSAGTPALPASQPAFPSRDRKGAVSPLVSITFDDGFRDFYTNAFPILNRYGFTATVFLPTAYIGQASREFKGAECLTWCQVRELRTAGIEFGSHTVTHPQLRDVTTAQMRTEVARSKDDIEEKLGERVDSFAYPYAFPETDAKFVETLHGALQDSEYQSGVTTIIGRAGRSDNPFFMRRLPVNSDDDPRLFQAKLEGGYDWLRTVQYASKRMTAKATPAER